ncbi:MAG: type IV pilin protein [Gemmatimonadota bacterium]
MARRPGFTFVEILVAMLVFSALTAVSVPRYRGYKLKAYLTTLRTDLGQIRIAQEAHWAESMIYTSVLPDLDWRQTSDVTMSVTVTDPAAGYTAIATHAMAPGVQCATFVGSDATTTPSGDIVCGPTTTTTGVGT